VKVDDGRPPFSRLWYINLGKGRLEKLYKFMLELSNIRGRRESGMRKLISGKRGEVPLDLIANKVHGRIKDCV
jgi:hypothetical protein